MSHTPGPWNVGKPKHNPKISVYSHEPLAEIATVHKVYYPDGQMKALPTDDNANLIAAAPDLLEACEAFAEAWEKCLQLEKTDVALRLAKAAISKAKGQ